MAYGLGPAQRFDAAARQKNLNEDNFHQIYYQVNEMEQDDASSKMLWSWALLGYHSIAALCISYRNNNMGLHGI
jgi:hypothetical protein